MTQIFVASTLFGAVTVAAAIDAGRFGPPGRRRMLLVSDNTAIPELGRDLTESPGFAGIRDRFDEVLSWNDEISPLHPSGWMPRTEELMIWERLFRDRWGLGGEPLELAVETIAASPARALTSIFSEAAITVYADGLMSYGPTRDGLPDGVGSRITRLLHPDLVPGLVPLLLCEHGVASETIPDDAFSAVLHKLNRPGPPADGLEGAALVVGQYLAALEILSEQEEDELHVAMLRGVVARGHTTVLFKPHPSSPVRTTDQLAHEAARLGARLLVLDAAVPAETWCSALRPSLIVGCFSTALVTASRYHGVPAATVGTGLLLQRLSPYQNSNRVPVTIIDATLPHLAEDGTLSTPFLSRTSDLHRLLVAVAYAMRAASLPERRGEAAAFLSEHASSEPMARYFKKRRLTALGLPGGLSPAKRGLLAAALPPRSRRRRIAARAFDAAGLDRDR
ncbi:polysialyltransferase family glycosyltransferase [Actinocorallia aurantiaca]|uniref:Alpha-2,8-polysialyltransferase family protein n=1 Tax=Actinocorallia aurantiaca TaxID=46204 RepID=A0ABN3UIP6_9ACTN